MDKLKSIVFSLIASSIVLSNLSFVPAQADPPPPPDKQAGSATFNENAPEKLECPTECISEPWPEKLGLSDDQMEKLVSLKSDYEVKNAEQKARLMTSMKQLMLQITSEKPDKNAILALNDKISSIKADLATSRVNQMLAGMDVLTAKQKEQLHHLLLVHMLSHQHGMGPMHHHMMMERH